MAAAGLIGAGMVVAEPVASAAPAITVTPNTGLVEGQTVTVTGTGFDPAQTSNGVATVCASSTGTFFDGCDSKNLAAAKVTVQPNGTFTKALTVHRIVEGVGGGSPSYDCGAVTTCNVMVTFIVPPFQTVRAPISFAEAFGTDLAVTKARTATRVPVDKVFTIRVQAFNLGPTATTWRVTQSYSGGAIPVAAKCPKGIAVGVATCEFGPVKPKLGKPATAKFQFKFPTSGQPPLSNRICVTEVVKPNGDDRNSFNNCKFVTVSIKL